MSPLDRPLRGRPKGLRRFAAWAGIHPYPKQRLSAAASYALPVAPRGSGPATEPGSPQPCSSRGKTVARAIAPTSHSLQAVGEPSARPTALRSCLRRRPRANRRPGGRRSPRSRFASTRPLWAALSLSRRIGSLVLSTWLGRQADPLRGRPTAVGAVAPTAEVPANSAVMLGPCASAARA